MKGVTQGYGALNGLGQRVGKTEVGGPPTTFVYDGAGRMIGRYNSTVTYEEHVYLGGLQVALLEPGGPYYVAPDHLGSPHQVTNGAGQVVWFWDHGAFGPAQPTGALVSFKDRFPGQFYDLETGLHYNGARDYDPTLGRYIESDPIGLAGGINTYAYADGNPLSYIDLLGLLDFSQLWQNYPTPADYPTSNPQPGQTTIWNMIGGKVAQNGNSGVFQNSCAVRMSYALNQSGENIPYTKGATVSGSNGKWYFYRISDLQRYLNSKLGNPQQLPPQNWRNSIGAKTGIVNFQANWADATGHFDLYNGSTTIDEHDYSTDPSAQGVQFYPVK